MPSPQAPLLARLRLSVANAGSARLEVSLDGWPLLLIDLDAGTVGVNDLRCSTMFAHAVVILRTREIGVRTGAVGNELYLLLGEVAVFVDVPSARGIHADVRVIALATGGLLFDRSVRYRQLAVVSSQASPVSADTGE